MDEATISISDELQAEILAVAEKQDRSPSEVIEVALREYFERLRLRQGGGEWTYTGQPFWVPVLEEKDDLGEPDVSINHDAYLADALIKKWASQST